MYRLYWSADTGAFVVQAVLEELGLPYERVAVDTAADEHRRPDYLALNPMGQIPTLRLPDGSLLTETAAMVLHLCDCRPEAGLLPAPATPLRAQAYRWLVFMAADLYEADLRYYYPARYTTAEDGATGVKEAALRALDRLFGIMEGVLEPGPYVLAQSFSACDLYLFMLTLWYPTRQRTLERWPRLGRLAREMRQRPAIQRIWSQHYPPESDSPWSTWTGSSTS